MPLESLFIDRAARKYIRESIDSAKDVGFGKCEKCGKEGNLRRAFKMNLCDACRKRLIAYAAFYGHVFAGQPTDEEMQDVLNESYFYVDIDKLENDAKSKFNGSITDLMQSYGINLQYDWHDSYKNGKIFLKDSDLKSGKKHINKFLIDYDAYHSKDTSFPLLVADADGTRLPDRLADGSIKSRGLNTARKSPWAQKPERGKFLQFDLNNPTVIPAPAAQAVSQPTTKPTPAQTPSASQALKSVKSTGKIKLNTVQGDVNSFAFSFGIAYNVGCTLTSNSGNVKSYELKFSPVSNSKVYPGDTISINVNGDNVGDLAQAVAKEIIEKPAIVVPAFAEENGKDYTIDKYGVAKFEFDEQSFAGRTVTMVMVYNSVDGKSVSSPDRVLLNNDKALLDRASLNAELERYMDGRIKKSYPVLFDENNVIKTSLGRITFELKEFAGSNPVITATVGPREISFESSKALMDNVANAREYLLDKLKQHFGEIIPGWGDRSYTVGAGNTVYTYTVGSGQDMYNVFLDFDENRYMSSGDLVFKCRVDQGGRSYPSIGSEEVIVYRKNGEPLEIFAKKIGDKLFKESDFGNPNKGGQLKQSAADKMRNPSKKQALFSRTASQFVNLYKQKIKELNDLDVEVEFSVDRDGKLSSAQVTVIDPYGDYSSSKELADKIKLNSIAKFLRDGKPDADKYATRRKEANVVYLVSDLEAFYSGVNMAVLEHLIFEAFGVTYITEVKRSAGKRLVIQA